MNNLARREFNPEINEEVKEELQIANIPVMKLPCYTNTEVKTMYIGILNGFVFYRAWTYWICQGEMPLDVANKIYHKYKDLNIRAGGHCGNVEPKSQSHNPVYDEQCSSFINELGVQEFLKRSENNTLGIEDDQSLPRFVNMYHIDTQLGLCKLAQTIITHDIHTENALILTE